MKKLLSLLGSISLIASTSGVAVSCGSSNTRIATPTLNGDRARELIAKLADSSDFGFTFGDLFSDIDITTTIVNEINRFVSINYNFATTNNTLGTLGLQKYGLTDGGNKAFETRFDNIIRTVAEDSLFNEYSKTIVNGPSPSFEMTLSKQLYSLNPIATTEVQSTDADGNTHTYYVAAGTKIQFVDSEGNKKWEVLGEDEDHVSTTNTPTIKDLTQEFTDGGKSPFKIAAFDTEDAANSSKRGEGGKDITITSKTALELRFQDYFNNKKMYDAMTNALTMVYNQSTMWRTSSDGAYFDITNPVFSKTGSWTTSDFHTNVKMVWTYTVPKTAADTVQAALKGTDKDKALDADGKFTANGITNLSGLVDAIKKVAGADTNKDTTDGNDPYFGLTGYKGVVVSQDGTTIGDNPISGAAYESAVNATDNLKNSGGITVQDSNSWYFQNADNKNNVDFVITLPIFILQLLGVDKAVSPKNDDEKANIYSIKGANVANDETDQKAISFDRSSSSQSSDSYTTLWKRNNKYKSEDVNTLASDLVKQESLFQQIQYLVSQDSNGQETAKKVIYSKYLDEDDIYYAGLYDQIGKYISKSDSEDE
jgi:hypothetical protein